MSSVVNLRPPSIMALASLTLTSDPQVNKKKLLMGIKLVTTKL
jgi:hypothetical protein